MAPPTGRTARAGNQGSTSRRGRPANRSLTLPYEKRTWRRCHVKTPRLALVITTVVGSWLAALPTQASSMSLERSFNPYARRHFYLGAEGVGMAVLHETGPRGFLQS